ncbi:hypothetical protein ACA910_018217 [Epithemia clementina (nom. ined.)]
MTAIVALVSLFFTIFGTCSSFCRPSQHVKVVHTSWSSFLYCGAKPIRAHTHPYTRHHQLFATAPAVRSNVVPDPAAVFSSNDLILKNDFQVFRMLERSNICKFLRKYGMSTKACNAALLQVAKSNVPQKGEIAVRLLRYMIDQGGSRSDVKPDLLSLNTVLAALSRSASPSQLPQISKLADDVFQEWKDLYHSGKVDLNVDIISFNSLLAIHTRAKNLKRAQEIFSEMKVQDGDCNQAVLPDAISCATLMHGYALEGNVLKVESLLQEMRKADHVSPTTVCLNELLYAYSRSRTPGRAEEFLKDWLEDKERWQVRPDVRSFNVVLHSLSLDSRPGALTRAERLFNRMPKHDTVSYNTLVSTYCSRLSGRVAVEFTEKAVNKAWLDADLEFDGPFISSLLYSLASVEAKEMPQCAERLVEAAIQRGIELNVDVYNALIYCWSKSGDYEAAKKARQIFASLEKNPKLKPNVKTYTNVLDCFAKSREVISLDFAVQMIQKMEQNGPKPNVFAYTALIQNYAKSRLPYKALEASKILQKMKTSKNPEVWPNIITYNAVLNAAEHSDSSGGAATEEALRVACVTFEEIRTSPLTANHVTYASFLGVLGKLMPSSARQEIVGLVFRRACKEGQVSPLVLRKLKQAVGTGQQFLSLMEGYDEESIPDSWKANVRENRARDNA